jgi:hypothetical protein
MGQSERWSFGHTQSGVTSKRDTGLGTKTIVAVMDDAPLEAASWIRSVEITKGPGPLPGGVFEQAPRIIATMDDETTVELFSFYSSERVFTREEFVGLTVDAARRLKFAPRHEPREVAHQSRGPTSRLRRSSEPDRDSRGRTMSACSPRDECLSRCIVVVPTRDMATMDVPTTQYWTACGHPFSCVAVAGLTRKMFSRTILVIRQLRERCSTLAPALLNRRMCQIISSAMPAISTTHSSCVNAIENFRHRRSD